MKTKIYLITVIVVIFTSCRSLNPFYSTAPKEPIETKILPLEKNYKDKESKWISDQIENISSVYGDKYGYININVGDGNVQKKGKALALGIWPGFGVPYLYGMPFCWYDCYVDLEIEIQDSKNVTIAKFSGKGFGRATVACYYGYSEENAKKKASVDAYNMAFKQIRTCLSSDVVKDINTKLKASGIITTKE